MSAPVLTWDAKFDMTKVELELILDPDISYTYQNISHGMPKVLPTSDFKWLDPREFDLKYTSNSSNGYVLEVDIEYPKELKELCNDYPLAPEKIEIKEKCCATLN